MARFYRFLMDGSGGTRHFGAGIHCWDAALDGGPPMEGPTLREVRGSGGVGAMPRDSGGSGAPCRWFHNRRGIVDGAVAETLAGFFAAELLFEELTRLPQFDPIVELVVDAAHTFTVRRLEEEAYRRALSMRAIGLWMTFEASPEATIRVLHKSLFHAWRDVHAWPPHDLATLGRLFGRDRLDEFVDPDLFHGAFAGLDLLAYQQSYHQDGGGAPFIRVSLMNEHILSYTNLERDNRGTLLACEVIRGTATSQAFLHAISAFWRHLLQRQRTM